MFASRPSEPGADAYFAHWRGKLALWTGVLGGPLAWSLQFLIGYVLSRFSCPRHWLAAVHHVVTLLLLASAVACTWLAWRDWQRIGRGEPADIEGGVSGRSRFLATLGILSGGLFALVIVAQWVPMFFLGPCYW